MGKLEASSEKFWNVVDKLLTGFSIILMGTMATLVVVSVIMRYVFNLTYVWSEELIIYLFVATTYFGSIICVKEMEHIDIPFIRDMAPKTVGNFMDIFVALVNIAVQTGLAFLSYTWIEKTGSSLTTGLYIPLYTVYLMFPICFFLMAIYTFRRIEKNIIPRIAESIKSRVASIITNIILFGIYAASLYGLVRLYIAINGIERIETSIRPAMMTQIFVIFSIMFAACAVLVVIYAINRLIAIFKKDTFAEVGGKQ